MQLSEAQDGIIHILSDGRPHHRSELLDLLSEESRTPKNLNDTLSNLRKKLRPLGQEIVCELKHRQIHYRHVRLISGVT